MAAAMVARLLFRIPSKSTDKEFHMRALWKGYLKLALVSCPVGLYPATSASERSRPTASDE